MLLNAAQISGQTERHIRKTTTSLVNTFLSKHRAPSLSIAVVRDGHIVYAHAWGFADLENRVRATSSTVYRTASVAKPITATAALILASRGSIDLDAPVQRYCPAYPSKRWPVTTRELLAHLGGVRHYRSDSLTDPEITSTTHYDSLTDAVRIFASDPLAYEPGTHFLYSTFGYVLVGCVLEGASHEKFTQLLKEVIFYPAGMTSSGADDISAIVPRRARPYLKTPMGKLINAPPTDESDKVSAGGLVSTVHDLAAFAVALESGKLLPATQLNMMWTPQRARDGTTNGYALGWGTFTNDGRLFIGHGGDQPGASAALYLIPAQRLAVAVMSNVNDLQVDDLAQQVLTAISTGAG